MSEQAVFDTLRYRIEVDKSGTRRYFNSAGELHRVNGPAVEDANGSKSWYQNDQCHRTDGPAIVWSNGNNSWWQHGLLHRADGPAIEYSDGGKAWYINGKRLTEAEFKEAVKHND